MAQASLTAEAESGSGTQAVIAGATSANLETEASTLSSSTETSEGGPRSRHRESEIPWLAISVSLFGLIFLIGLGGLLVAAIIIIVIMKRKQPR